MVYSVIRDTAQRYGWLTSHSPLTDSRVCANVRLVIPRIADLDTPSSFP